MRQEEIKFKKVTFVITGDSRPRFSSLSKTFAHTLVLK